MKQEAIQPIFSVQKRQAIGIAYRKYPHGSNAIFTGEKFDPLVVVFSFSSFIEDEDSVSQTPEARRWVLQGKHQFGGNKYFLSSSRDKPG